MSKSWSKCHKMSLWHVCCGVSESKANKKTHRQCAQLVTHKHIHAKQLCTSVKMPICAGWGDSPADPKPLMFFCDTGATADAPASLLARLLWDAGPIPILLSRLLPSPCKPLLGAKPVPMPLSRMLSGTVSSPCNPLLGTVLIPMLLSRILSGTVSSSCGPASTSWRVLDTLPCVLWMRLDSIGLLLLELAEASCLPAPYMCKNIMSFMQLKQQVHLSWMESLQHICSLLYVP